MENSNANLKNLGKNKLYLILIGLAAIILATVLIYSYVEFSGTRITKISVVQTGEGKPYCGAIGSRSEGWYIDSDSGGPELIRWENCDGCSAVCKAIGTRSEGWYSSCDGELIKYDNCSTTNIECKTDEDCKGVKCPGVYCDNGKCVCPPGGTPLPEEKCGIENCHGLDITCGPNIPDMCTEIYMIGDGCRKYAECKIINGKCQLVQNKKFEDCKSCVEKCSEDFKNDPINLSQCAYKCAEAGEKQTCNEKCKSLNYKSGVCRMSCETWNNEVNMGYTSDCNPPCPQGMFCAAVMYDCCCQKETQEDCAKEGEQVNRNPLMGSIDKQCCEGLIENRVSKSYSICEKPAEDCAKEGESVPVVPGALKCCEGLTKISCAKPDANGICPEGCVGASICANCGNGICGLGENICNCPEDCEGKESCTPKGESDHFPFNCCPGLVPRSCNLGEGYPEPISVRCCIACGDGVCEEKFESRYNCLEDCKEETTCIGDGEMLRDLQGAKGECCMELHEISSGYRDGVAYCTSEVCGNGECKAKENEWNCPKDCKEGETLSADLNCDGNVNLADAAILLSFWEKDPSGAASCQSPDINQDGKVNLADFSIIMSQWTK